uniref:Uncharacterized protein n=1 Tax=Echinococcus granulosus TaxID=6210 RepID=A0A068WMH6_ECHGR|nr:hypothetical protein EgrG_000671600 [Echinococcus granulosus]
MDGFISMAKPSEDSSLSRFAQNVLTFRHRSCSRVTVSITPMERFPS